jgi:hypothetical protein
MTLLSLVSESFASFWSAPSFWSNPLFEKEKWEVFTKVLRIGLAMTGALLLIYEIRARRMAVRIPERTRRRFAWFLTILSFFTFFDFFNPNVRYSEYYHRHEFYHYYLGSKYFKEVGYTRLYECSRPLGQPDQADLADVHPDGSGSVQEALHDGALGNVPERDRLVLPIGRG